MKHVSRPIPALTVPGPTQALLLHVDISYRKPIRAESGKIVNKGGRLSVCPSSHNKDMWESGGERHNEERKGLTSVNWRENQHQAVLRSVQHPTDKYYRYSSG
jgi:hypothetical protein